jgi:glycerol uptake facilitator-like aquaporin
MNAQIFILLIAGVSIIRLVKGIFSKTKPSIKDEVNDFFSQSIATVVLFLVIYGVLNIF